MAYVTLYSLGRGREGERERKSAQKAANSIAYLEVLLRMYHYGTILPYFPYSHSCNQLG